MKTIIYYFSGTGNSLKVARDIAAGLGGAELVAIPSVGTGRVVPEAECVGIVYPVYMWGLPLIVGRFLANLDAKGRYVFAVATYGGMPGGALRQAAELLSQRGVKLASGFGVKMPGNYIPMYGAKPKETQQKLFDAAAKKVGKIVSAVHEGRESEPEAGNFLINHLLSGIVYGFYAPRIPSLDKSFWSDERCNCCGTCVKVCPVANIELRDGRPTWQHRCEQCMACIQWCPQEAIQYGKKTRGRKRYRHPDATVQDIEGKKQII